MGSKNQALLGELKQLERQATNGSKCGYWKSTWHCDLRCFVPMVVDSSWFCQYIDAIGEDDLCDAMKHQVKERHARQDEDAIQQGEDVEWLTVYEVLPIL
eukprot:5230775-Amphidinium_carterae.1